MPDPTSVSTTAEYGAEATYQPISLLALAGLITAVLFTVVLAAVGISALLTGVPFSLDWWWLVLPFAGVGLSLAALWQIRLSEGTRAGRTLALIGFWLSLLT